MHTVGSTLGTVFGCLPTVLKYPISWVSNTTEAASSPVAFGPFFRDSDLPHGAKPQILSMTPLVLQLLLPKSQYHMDNF